MPIKKKPEQEVENGEEVKKQLQDEVASLKEIHSELMQQSSKPTEEVIEKAKEEAALEHMDYAHLRDSKGATFDPEIHQHVNGVPKLSKNGKLIRKRRKASVVTKDEQEEDKKVLTAEEQLQARKAGAVAANLLIGTAMLIDRAEWNPIKDDNHGIDERAELETAFGDYFVHKGITDFPPGAALTVAVSAYVLPRIGLPKTSSKMETWKNKLKAAWYWIKAKIKRKPRNGAHGNIRDDRKRKNDTSQEDSARIAE